jgi:hypothetical protein
MTKTIWKFKLSLGPQVILMPIGSMVLSAQMQDGSPTMWAICNREADNEPVDVLVVGTGFTLDMVKYPRYVGTVQDVPYVWHVFTS